MNGLRNNGQPCAAAVGREAKETAPLYLDNAYGFLRMPLDVSGSEQWKDTSVSREERK